MCFHLRILLKPYTNKNINIAYPILIKKKRTIFFIRWEKQ